MATGHAHNNDAHGHDGYDSDDEKDMMSRATKKQLHIHYKSERHTASDERRGTDDER